MLSIDIPDFGRLNLEHLVLDYNGTLAMDGKPAPGVADRLRRLGGDLGIHVLTADTFGNARAELSGFPEMALTILDPKQQAPAKRDYIKKLGASRVVCVGNGRNDRLMLETAILGIAVVQGEGAAGDAARAADLVTNGITEALDLLLNPKRLVATLRG